MARCCRQAYKQRNKDQLRQAADDLPDGGHGTESEKTNRPRSLAVRWNSIWASRASRNGSGFTNFSIRSNWNRHNISAGCRRSYQAGRNSASASHGHWLQIPSSSFGDEVTSALDQLVAEGILKLLARLQDTLNLAYMFITHDLATVKSIADEVVVMKDGRVVEAGPKKEMFKPPHHAYTDLLLSSVPEMDPNWLNQAPRRTGS